MDCCLENLKIHRLTKLYQMIFPRQKHNFHLFQQNPRGSTTIWTLSSNHLKVHIQSCLQAFGNKNVMSHIALPNSNADSGAFGPINNRHQN